MSTEVVNFTSVRLLNQRSRLNRLFIEFPASAPVASSNIVTAARRQPLSFRNCFWISDTIIRKRTQKNTTLGVAEHRCRFSRSPIRVVAGTCVGGSSSLYQQAAWAYRPDPKIAHYHACYWIGRVRCRWCSGGNRSRQETSDVGKDSDAKVQRQGNPQRGGEDVPEKSRNDSSVDSALRQMQSLPNVITMTRIATTPILSYLVVNERYDLAMYGCLIAGFTDWLDGHIAKKYDMGTVLGTYLDPLADKITINVLAASLWYNSILPGPVVGIWMTKDVALMVMTYWRASLVTKEGDAVWDPAKIPLKVKPTTISKVNTMLQFLTLAAGMTQPLYGIPHHYVVNLCWVTAGTTAASALSYIDGASLTASGNTIRDQVDGGDSELCGKAQKGSTMGKK